MDDVKNPAADIVITNPGKTTKIFKAIPANEELLTTKPRYGLLKPVFTLQTSNALRGALVRTGRATSKNWEDNEGIRSLYDAGAEGSSVLRSQRGILQQEQPLIVIDADDGQLMRYGR
uniref:Uncharacterized protein n=1 Tax=Meloidogyne floridensis TaxID=298350 RepID=A0A915NUP8_9BILA